MPYTFCVCALVGFAVAAPLCQADIVYSTAGSAYSQNFDFPVLARNNTDDGITFTNDSTIVGWHLFTVTSGSNSTPVAAGSYDTHTGATTAAGFYSFGTPDGNDDRALGGIGGGTFYGASSISAGAVAGWIAASINNATGSTLERFALSFDGEQWRRGSSNTTPSTMTFEYGFGSAFAGISNWTAPGGNFNWTTPVTGSGDPNPIDGNVAGLVAGRGGTVTGLNWTNGTTLWLRWLEINDDGFDHGVAIDNVMFSAAVPEPRALLFGSSICGVIGLTAASKKLFRMVLAAIAV